MSGLLNMGTTERMGTGREGHAKCTVSWMTSTRLQEMFDFVRYAHFTRPFLNTIGFDIICACVPRQHTRE
jgi:hypothetical protein